MRVRNNSATGFSTKTVRKPTKTVCYDRYKKLRLIFLKALQGALQPRAFCRKVSGVEFVFVFIVCGGVGGWGVKDFGCLCVSLLAVSQSNGPGLA